MKSSQNVHFMSNNRVGIDLFSYRNQTKIHKYVTFIFQPFIDCYN